MQLFMKKEPILGMALEKSKLNTRMELFGSKVAEHLAKCAMYGDSLPENKYNYWISHELATYISNINNTVCKHNNNKLKATQYETIFFGWLSKDAAEAEGNLCDLQAKNEEARNPYPYVPIDDDMIQRMTAISSAVIDKFVPLLSCINTITKQDIEQIPHHIIDPVCKVKT